jgi:hypothetical protein
MPSAPSQFLRRTWIDHTCEVQTDAGTLHALLSDIDGWPSWTPGLHEIRRKSPGVARPGDRFRMVLTMPPLKKRTLPAEMYVNEPGRIEWGGGAGGAVIRHSFELTPLGPGRTQLRHVEYATSFLALFALPFERAIYRHDKGWSDAIVARFSGD